MRHGASVGGLAAVGNAPVGSWQRSDGVGDVDAMAREDIVGSGGVV